MSKIKTAVVGVGHMGREHARIYSQLDHSTLVGVLDVDIDVGRRVAQQYNIKHFDKISDLINEVDALTIATPTSSHFDVASECIKAGKHVLVEKPLALDTEQALKLVELAKEHKVALQVGHIERFNPVLKALEDRLTHPRFIEAHRLSPYPGRSTDIGVVMDLMIHDLEIILHLVKSKVASIDAVGIPVLSKGEDIANARLRFEDGCVANITTSRISPEKMRKIRVFQEDAYLSLDYQKQDGEIYRRMGGQITRDPIPVEKDEPLKCQLSSFLECISSGLDPVVSGDHAFEALKVAACVMQEIAKNIELQKGQ